MSYSRLDLSDRLQIEKLLALGNNAAQIAATISRNPTSISRELNRFKKGCYDALSAQVQATGKQLGKRRGVTRIDRLPKLKNFVYSKLEKRWPPQKISDNLKLFYPFDPDMQISHESIYFHIYVQPKKEVEKMLIERLRQKRKYRGNTRRGLDKRTTIKDPVRIDERPKEADSREIPGHWEGDLVLGKNRDSAIGTLVERTSRFLIIVPLKYKDATSVRNAFERAFKNIPKHLKRSLTYDNGTEMAQHAAFTKNTKIKVFFAQPYSPWQRPTNENTNGLIRDYFPKGTDFNLVSRKELKKVQNEINDRPRNVLEMDNPINCFERFMYKNNF